MNIKTKGSPEEQDKILKIIGLFGNTDSIRFDHYGHPLCPWFVDTLATAYQGLGRLKEALEQFELCL